MTKYILPYTLLSLSLFVTACSDEVTSDGNKSERGRIEFSASLPGISSRATEVTGTTIDNIRVSSFTVGESSTAHKFLDKIFSRNSVTGKFVSTDPECIWPNNNDLLRFVAFVPSCEDLRLTGDFGDKHFTLPSAEEGKSVSLEDYKLSDFKIAHDIANQVDFVAAIGSGNLLDNEDTPIDLHFQHQLSRIELKAWGASTSYNVEIAGVRLGGVSTEGIFNFATLADDGETIETGRWESLNKGSVEYIFRAGDRIVIFDRTAGSASSSDEAVSIMGSQVSGEKEYYDNSAMLIPSDNQAWDYKGNATNGDNHTDGMYFSVLMRITDVTPYASPTNPLVYPYSDNAEKMEVVYLAVDKTETNKVLTRLYSQGDEYFTDPKCTLSYNPEANSAVVKAFGWAALPVADKWEPGFVYTYTLNYTNGVGLRDPRDPKPGEPIISDKVLINVNVNEWVSAENKDITVPRR